MTGPDHYTKSELLLSVAGEAEGGSTREAYLLAAAQVHATLAVAAAHAASDMMQPPSGDEWLEAIS